MKRSRPIVVEDVTPAGDGGVHGIPATTLSAVSCLLLEAAGMQPDDAAVVAAALLSADLRATPSHGLVRLPFLARRLTDGGADPRGRPTVVADALAVATVDGGRALGPVTSAFAMRLAIDKARKTGAGVVAVRNSDFFGTCAHPAMMAAAEDMVGLVWTNGNPGMTPWGGARSGIGNNPLGIAAPRGAGAPVVLDMAMSVSAGGRIRLHAARGEPIPADWAVDRDGNATTDPHDFLDGGALQPLGHKGFGLAVMGEILAGALAGANLLSQVPAWFSETSKPVGSGHIHIALDIAAFGGVADFKARVDSIVDELKAVPLRPGVSEILMPGERAAREHERQTRDGIQMPLATVAALRSLAVEFGVEARVATLLAGGDAS